MASQTLTGVVISDLVQILQARDNGNVHPKSLLPSWFAKIQAGATVTYVIEVTGDKVDKAYHDAYSAAIAAGNDYGNWNIFDPVNFPNGYTQSFTSTLFGMAEAVRMRVTVNAASAPVVFSLAQ